MMVVTTMVVQPRKTAFCVGLPNTENPDHTGGSAICKAMATAATVTMEPTSINQPPSHAPTLLLTGFAHW